MPHSVPPLPYFICNTLAHRCHFPALICHTLAHHCHPLSATIWPTSVIPYPQHSGPLVSSLIRNTLAHYYSVIPYPQHSGPLVSSLIRSTLAHFCHPLSATLWPTFVIPYPQHFGPPLSSLIGNTLAHHCHPLSATLWPIIGNTLAHHCHPLFAASCPNITILYTVRNTLAHRCQLPDLIHNTLAHHYHPLICHTLDHHGLTSSAIRHTLSHRFPAWLILFHRSFPDTIITQYFSSFLYLVLHICYP